MKTVIEMARIAGARDDGQRFEFELRDLEFLVALVRADEREACAKVCETHAPTTTPSYVSYAAAIRARRTHEV